VDGNPRQHLIDDSWHAVALECPREQPADAHASGEYRHFTHPTHGICCIAEGYGLYQAIPWMWVSDAQVWAEHLTGDVPFGRGYRAWLSCIGSG
jgi:hypothetical protein